MLRYCHCFFNFFFKIRH